MFVLDASVATAMILKETEVAAPDAILERLAAEGAIVPSVWKHEVANSLLTALRKGRVDWPGCLARLDDLNALPIEVDLHGIDVASTTTFFLAQRHQLTIYDAAYLELAIRLLVPIATFDHALQRAARAEMIELLMY